MTTNKILDHLIKPPHALILQTQFCCDLDRFLVTYGQKILTLNGVKDSVFCQKIADGHYDDWLVIDGEERVIRKNDILALEERCQTYVVEKTGIRFCIIKKFNHANEAAYSAFLKFLEEPPKNTYLILTTPHTNLLPRTIVSRCERLILEGSIENIPSQWKNIAPIFSTIQDFEVFLKTPFSGDLQEWLSQFQKHTDFRSCLNKFKGWDYQQITVVLTVLKQFGSPSFREQLTTLLPTLIANPTKSLLFFTVWEAW